MPWPSLMWQQWTAALLGMSTPLGCRESRAIAAAQLGKICYWNCRETKKISFKKAPNTLTFQEVQFSTGSLQLLLILHNPSCILPLRKHLCDGLPVHLQRKEQSLVFPFLCHPTDKMNSATTSTSITQKSIIHSTHCTEIYISPSLFLLGICGSMVIYLHWNRSTCVLAFFSCLQASSLVQM